MQADFVTRDGQRRADGFALKGGDPQAIRLRTLYDGVCPQLRTATR